MKQKQLATPSNLELAWRRITTGGNHQYKRLFRPLYVAYEVALDDNLADLRKRLDGGSFEPRQPERVYLPKSSGLHRSLSLLHLEDQIVLQAFANLAAKKLYPHRAPLQFKVVFSNILQRDSSIFFFKRWQETYAAFQRRTRAGLMKRAITIAKKQRPENFTETLGACYFLAVAEGVEGKHYSRFLKFQPALLQALLPERLKASHPSLPANPDVAAAFFRTGMIEAWGRGIEKMLAACRDAGVPEPTFSTEGSGLWTTFRFTTRGTAAAQQPASGPGAGQVTPQVTPQVETLLVLLAEQALSGTQIRAGLRLKDRMHLQKAYVAPAIEAGLVEMTIPDRPSSRLQKYRLTAQGKAALAAARKA